MLVRHLHGTRRLGQGTVFPDPLQQHHPAKAEKGALLAFEPEPSAPLETGFPLVLRCVVFHTVIFIKI